jgi:hypothetical protein
VASCWFPSTVTAAAAPVESRPLAQNNVRRAFAGDGADTLIAESGSVDLVQQMLAAAEQNRADREMHLVDQAGAKILANGGNSAAETDIEAAGSEGIKWIEEHPFVRDVGALKAQLAALRAQGGGDEPESLLDALYKVATMEASPKGSQSEDANKWRYRSDAARVVVVFTDASFKETMSIPEAKGGALQDVANVVMANRIILSLFAPNFEGYDRLSQIDKSEWEVVEYEGMNPQEALQKFTADPANFRNTLKQLAASVSRSAETVAL